MSRRTLLVLSAVCAVLILVVFLGQRAETPQTTMTGERLLPSLSTVVNDVERLEIVKAENERVATLERRDGRWRVLERDGYPADFSRIRQALLAFAEARIVERGTANPELYERLGVEDVASEIAGGAAIRLHAAGREPISVIVGDAAARGHRYVRPAGEAQSYLIDRDPELPRQTADWLDPMIIDVEGHRVAEVTITHADGETLRIFKSSPGEANFAVENVPEGRELQYPGVANATGNGLRELRLEDVTRAADREDEATVAVFRTFDGLTVTARGSRRNGEAWATFSAAVAEADGAEELDDEAAAAEQADSAGDPHAEAQAINERVEGWRYRIPAHQYEQMTRRMEDLLQPASAD